MKQPDRVKFHRDDTVTYWSVYRQVWTREPISRIPDAELAAMPPDARKRIIRRARSKRERGEP